MDDMIVEALSLRGLDFYAELFSGYVKTLLSHGAQNLVDDLAQILHVEDHTTNESLLDRLRGFILQAQEQLLGQHGIIMTLEAMAERDEVLQTLLEIQHTDEAVIYTTLIETFEDPVVVLCEVVSHAQGTHADNYLPLVHSVNDALWEKAYAMLSSQIEDLPTQPVSVDAERKTQVRAYYDTYNNPITQGYTDGDFAYGDTPESILKKVDIVYQDMNNRSPETANWIAECFYGVLLFSGTRKEKFMEMGKSLIDEHVLDPLLVVRGQAAFSQLCIRGGKRAST